MRDGHRSKVIARLARVLLRLPRPEALLALATDCGLVERAIVAQALAMAQVRCPTLAPRLVPGRFHLQDLFADKMNDFRIATRSEEHTSELQSLMRLSYAVFCLE